jgi:hypothetical protein
MGSLFEQGANNPAVLQEMLTNIQLVLPDILHGLKGTATIAIIEGKGIEIDEVPVAGAAASAAASSKQTPGATPRKQERKAKKKEDKEKEDVVKLEVSASSEEFLAFKAQIIGELRKLNQLYKTVLTKTDAKGGDSMFAAWGKVVDHLEELKAWDESTVFELVNWLLSESGGYKKDPDVQNLELAICDTILDNLRIFTHKSAAEFLNTPLQLALVGAAGTDIQYKYQSKVLIRNFSIETSNLTLNFINNSSQSFPL